MERTSRYIGNSPASHKTGSQEPPEEARRLSWSCPVIIWPRQQGGVCGLSACNSLTCFFWIHHLSADVWLCVAWVDSPGQGVASCWQYLVWCSRAGRDRDIWGYCRYSSKPTVNMKWDTATQNLWLIRRINHWACNGKKIRGATLERTAACSGQFHLLPIIIKDLHTYRLYSHYMKSQGQPSL